jgi:hypothetical protein
VVRQSTEAQQRNPLHTYHNRCRLINYGGCYYFESITLQVACACAWHCPWPVPPD